MNARDGRPTLTVGERVVAFDLRDRHRPGGSGALAVVCGLPVLVRSLLLLERAGFRHAWLLVDPDDRPLLADSIEPHLRLRPRAEGRLVVSWIERADRTLGVIASALPETGVDVLYWPGELSCGLIVPDVAMMVVPSDHAVVAAGEGSSGVSGPILIGREALLAHAHSDEAGLVEALARQGRLTRTVPAPQMVRIVSDADRARAVSLLLRSLRKQADGELAKYNRYVSLPITSWLAGSSVTPNQATLAAGSVGLLSGVCAATGGYWWLLLGAILYQISNILDGIDGELARVKLLESRLGEWCDTVSDDLTNVAFTVGTAIGCWRTWHSDTYLGLGVITAAGLAITAAIMYHGLITTHRSGDLNAFLWPWEQGNRLQAAARFPGNVRFLFRRDAFAYMAVAASLAGQARVTAWLAALGATAPWVLWVFHTVRMRPRRPACRQAPPATPPLRDPT